jgi:hypothetical protein
LQAKEHNTLKIDSTSAQSIYEPNTNAIQSQTAPAEQKSAQAENAESPLTIEQKYKKLDASDNLFNTYQSAAENAPSQAGADEGKVQIGPLSLDKEQLASSAAGTLMNTAVTAGKTVLNATANSSLVQEATKDGLKGIVGAAAKGAPLIGTAVSLASHTLDDGKLTKKEVFESVGSGVGGAIVSSVGTSAGAAVGGAAEAALVTAVGTGVGTAAEPGGGTAGGAGLGAAIGIAGLPSGAAVGGAVGGIGGSIVGGYLGGKAGDLAYDAIPDFNVPLVNQKWKSELGGGENVLDLTGLTGTKGKWFW